MYKPEWGVLQQRFLSEHAETGVSPKEWCEAQELNYNSARRYITKPAAQETAQKEVRKARCQTWLWLRLLRHLTAILRRKAQAT
ncbi:hypothetical protein FDW94_18010 [Citrobacter sp. wls757]|nr:hypothetical protein FDW94_18010 [Citrobacter sp. wls757]